MDTTNNSNIVMVSELTVRSGEIGDTLTLQILPKDSRIGFWVDSSSFIKVSMKEYQREDNIRILSIKGKNDTSENMVGSIKVTLDNGTEAECIVTVLPDISEPPKLQKTPAIRFVNGKAVIDYEFYNIGNSQDESEISWYRQDYIIRDHLEKVDFSKVSNEKDSRKIAVSRDNKPCKEIYLTTADIGKHLKVNIKPKHSNSKKGAGLNIISDIVNQVDVNDKVIKLDVETLVNDNTYNIEDGYYNIKGDFSIGNSFDNEKELALITDSMGCGIYYCHESEKGDMSIDATIVPECTDGNGFNGTHQYEEIYIKYDPKNGNGYGLRISGTAGNDGEVVCCLYKYKNGNGTPISNEYKSGAFKPGCEIRLEIKGDTFKAFVNYDDSDDFYDIELTAKIQKNIYGGFGFMHMAEVTSGYRGALKHLEARY